MLPARARCTRAWLPLLVAHGAWALSFPASAAPAETPKAACLTAHREAQVKRRDGALLAARQELVACAQATCPGLLRTECTSWLAEIEREIPSIVVRAVDGTNDVTDVSVAIDGVVVRDRLDGRPIALDPGAHAVRCERSTGPHSERTVLLGVGERARLIEFDLTPPQRPDTQPERPTTTRREVSRPIPLSVWAGGGVALASLAGASVAGGLGFAERQQLASTCAPFCSEASVLPVRVKYAVADAALGVAAVATGVTLWMWLAATNDTNDTNDTSAADDAGALAPRAVTP